MKTQLLQDIDENGSQAKPQARPAGPAPQVWRRTRQEQSQPQPAPRGARPEAPAAPVPDHSPRPPRDPPRAAPAGPSMTETRPVGATSPHTGSATDIPGWLAERLREDAERDERAEWRSQWQRRAVTWSMGVSLLAIVAAGGLWLYEDNRVEGALGVVAHTTPEPQPPAEPVPIKLPVDNRPVDQPSVLSVMPDRDPAPRTAGTDPASIAVAEPLPSEPPIVPIRAAAAPSVQAATQPAPQARPRERRRARQTASAATASGATPSNMSARQRREETLMQCRAHGYDQRQCDRKNCEMTRFGFACKG